MFVTVLADKGFTEDNFRAGASWLAVRISAPVDLMHNKVVPDPFEPGKRPLQIWTETHSLVERVVQIIRQATPSLGSLS